MSVDKLEDLSVDEILSRIRSEVARRKGKKQVHYRPLPRMKPYSKTQAPFPIKDHYHISEFLTYHDEEFVINAYQGVLRRYPDENGLKLFLDHLRTGRLTRKELLGRFRYSPEGRQHRITVKGLTLPFVFDTFCRIPVLGYVARVLGEIVLAPVMNRRFRIVENLFYGLQSTLKTELQGIEETIDTLDETSRNQLEELGEMFTEHYDDVERSMATMDSRKADQVAFDALEEENKALRYHVLDMEKKYRSILADLRKIPADESASAGIDTIASNEDDHLLDAMYVSFQDRFRGKRSDIQRIQQLYLPLIAEVGAGTTERPILDLGCGRGEWLELLKQHNFHAKGVDLNRVMADNCQELGLDVHQMDAIEFLQTLPKGSLGAVTGFHIIEHVPFLKLVHLLDEVHDKLAPGGAVIFETPNPGNILVGAHRFYFDPTHRNPLPSLLSSFLLESRGFVDVTTTGIAELPDGEHKMQPLQNNLNDFNKLAIEPNDYAVIGYKKDTIN